MRYVDMAFPRLHAEILKKQWDPGDCHDTLDGWVEKLLRCGADPNQKGPGGLRPLHLAAGHPSDFLVEALLEHGAKPGKRDGRGGTAFHHAVRRRTSSSDMFIVGKPNGKSKTAAQLDSISREIDAVRVIELLAGVGADPDARDKYDNAPIHLAAAVDSRRLVDALARVKADLNGRGGDECDTPVHIAVRHGALDAAKALLANGADPDREDCEGAPPLHYAADSGNAEMVRALLDGGADPMATNIVNRTAISCAWGECERIIAEAQEKAKESGE